MQLIDFECFDVLKNRLPAHMFACPHMVLAFHDSKHKIVLAPPAIVLPVSFEKKRLPCPLVP